jgi:hypothetical protein
MPITWKDVIDVSRIPDHRDLAIEEANDDLQAVCEQLAGVRLALSVALDLIKAKDRRIAAQDRAHTALIEGHRRQRAEYERRLAHARDEYRRLQAEHRRLRASIMAADAAKVAA